jgi:hypothetical protein
VHSREAKPCVESVTDTVKSDDDRKYTRAPTLTVRKRHPDTTSHVKQCVSLFLVSLRLAAGVCATAP